MRNPLLDVVENKYKRGNDLDFEIGDTVVVTIRIVEGKKERLQDYEGTVIARRGGGESTTLNAAGDLVPAIMHLTIEEAWWPAFDEFYALYLELCR